MYHNWKKGERREGLKEKDSTRIILIPRKGESEEKEGYVDYVINIFFNILLNILLCSIIKIKNKKNG